MPFECQAFTPIAGDSPVRFRILFTLFRNSAEREEGFLTKHVIGRCLEIISSKLKQMSKEPCDNLKETVDQVSI
jgi:hypothetical protein